LKTYSFYPGCFVEGSEVEYAKSCEKVFHELGIGIKELEDWNCCGALELTTNKALVIALSARNASIAERMGYECIVPCNICYNNLRKAEHEIKNKTKVGEIAIKALKEAGINYEAKIPIRHLLDVLINDVGIEEIKAHVKKPLSGLKVAPYYGCLVVRPSKICAFENPVNPTSMDNILETLGAEVINFEHKVKCCGGSTLMGDRDTSFELSAEILEEAVRKGADCIAVVCPMCHTMLDGQQAMIESQMGKKFGIPVLYLTQLMGVAMGLSSSDVALDKNIVPAENILNKISKEGGV
jgi:heterodisulfide reductase subunit B